MTCAPPPWGRLGRERTEEESKRSPLTQEVWGVSSTSPWRYSRHSRECESRVHGHCWVLEIRIWKSLAHLKPEDQLNTMKRSGRRPGLKGNPVLEVRERRWSRQRDLGEGVRAEKENREHAFTLPGWNNIKIGFTQAILLPQMPARVNSRLLCFLFSGVCGFTVEPSRWPQTRSNRQRSKGDSLHLRGILPLKENTLIANPIADPETTER